MVDVVVRSRRVNRITSWTVRYPQIITATHIHFEIIVIGYFFSLARRRRINFVFNRGLFSVALFIHSFTGCSFSQFISRPLLPFRAKIDVDAETEKLKRNYTHRTLHHTMALYWYINGNWTILPKTVENRIVLSLKCKIWRPRRRHHCRCYGCYGCFYCAHT